MSKIENQKYHVAFKVVEILDFIVELKSMTLYEKILWFTIRVVHASLSVLQLFSS